ncbi:hypothetical protein [Streptomyces sp. NPDC018972]
MDLPRFALGTCLLAGFVLMAIGCPLFSRVDVTDPGPARSSPPPC